MREKGRTGKPMKEGKTDWNRDERIDVEKREEARTEQQRRREEGKMTGKKRRRGRKDYWKIKEKKRCEK